MNQTRDLRLIKDSSRVSDPQSYYAKSWALVIGIDRYRDASSRLANARNDAVAVADVLDKIYGFEHIITLYDEEATKDEIVSWLRDKLPAQIQRDDRLIIFFAGHGASRENSSGLKRGYLVPHEAEFGRFADYVDMFELRDACGWIPAKHILILLDCCFSGIVAVTARNAAVPNRNIKLTEGYIKNITERGAWQVLTAGALDELVADSGSRPGHSAFTSALLAGLHGGADHNQDRLMTASDLATFVKPEVSGETTAAGGKGQMPFFSYLAGSDQGDFVLIIPEDTFSMTDSPMREADTAGTLAFEAVGKFMEEDGWHPQTLDDNYVYRAYFVGHNGEVTCFAQVRVDLEQFIFYVVMPVRAPAPMRLAVSEYITRANYGLRIGNFEMDFDDGEVRYKSSLDFEGVDLTAGLIRNTIYPAVQTMDRYLPGALSVIYGGKSAEEAITAIEAEE